MRLRRAPEPVSDRVWARLTPRAEEGVQEADGAAAGAPAGAAGEVATASPEPWVPTRPGAAESRAHDGGRRARSERGDTHDVRGRRRLRVEVPGRLRGADWVVSHRAALGMAVVVALAVAIFGLRLAWAGTADAPRLIRPATTVPGGTPDGAATAAPSASARAPTRSPGALPGTSSSVGPQGFVVVDVVGQVVHPGLVRLSAGSRVADALAAVGGVTEGADVAALNQARLLLDGEQIRVPAPGEVVPGGAGAGSTPGGSGAGGGAGGGGSGGGTPAGGLVSLNQADLAALDGLPGVGPVLAQRILDWRTAHGRFTAVDELGEVTGIGDKLLSQLRPLVTL